MVLYFRVKEDLDRERAAHQRTRDEIESLKREKAELRAAQQQQHDAEQREFMQQQAEINRIMLDTLRLLVAEVRELRAQRNDSANSDGNSTTTPP